MKTDLLALDDALKQRTQQLARVQVGARGGWLMCVLGAVLRS